MKIAKTTIKDVAEKAQVSISTVSRVINNSGYVNAETKHKVMEAIRELDFEPNPLAKGLGGGKSNTIGLILPDITNLFFPSIARGVEDAATVQGYTVILGNTDNVAANEESYLNVLERKSVDGIIIAGSSSDGSRIQELTTSGLPVVLVDRTFPSLTIDSVTSDNLEGAYLAVKHLVTLGHEKILFLGGGTNISTTQEREQGYLKALRESGIPINRNLIHYGDYRFESGFDRLIEVLEKGLPFTAVFAANDLIAIGAIRAIQSRNLHVPQDFSVVGFDDIFWAKLERPPLTTVAQPIYRMGMIACELLLDKIKLPSQQEPRHIVLKPDLVLRQSTAALSL